MTDDNPIDMEARRKAKAKAEAKNRPAESVDAENVAALRGRYVYLTGQDRYYDTMTATSISKSAVDTSHRAELGRGASNKLVEGDSIEIVQGPTWVPNGPQFVERGRARYLNTYDPPNEKPMAGDVSLFLDLAAYLIPDESIRDHFLDWFAFAIQRPEIKPNWQLLFGGQEGIGKDSLLYPLRRAVGFHNTVTIGPHDLENQFNDWVAGKKIGLLNEWLAFRNPRIENQLKQYCADPPSELQINPKGASRYTVPNLVGLVAMTNHRSQGMTLSKYDRRWLAYWSPAKPRPAEYYEKLWPYLEGDGGLCVWQWLIDRDLSGFNPKGRAPDTDYKRELIEVSEDPNLAILRDRIEEEQYPFDSDIVVMDQVERFLNNPKLDQGTIGGLLRELGCEDKRASSKLSGKTESVRVWIVRRLDHFKGLRSVDLFKLAQKAKEPRFSRHDGDSFV